MDVEDLDGHQNLAYDGFTLTGEELYYLQSSLRNLRADNDFRKVYFWGKLMGQKRNCYASYGYNDNILLGQRYFYSTNLRDWILLPPVSKRTKALTPICNSLFMGDPSFMHDVLCEKEDPTLDKMFGDETTIVKLKEEDRLAATIAMINQDCAIVPRGAVIKTSDAKILENQKFMGLSLHEAEIKKNYVHLRLPQYKYNTNLLMRKKFNPALDFLDTIDLDVPHNCRTFRLINEHTVNIRSLFWPGMLFYHKINRPIYGNLYMGDGFKNLDVPFMLNPKVLSWDMYFKD